MAEICVHPVLQRVATQPRHIDQQQIARCALEMYAAHDDFTLLHTVTACHAFALIVPYAGDLTKATRYLWQAVLIAALTVAHHTDATAAADPQRSWQQCLHAAVTSLDDHVIKLVYTAWRGFETTQDPLYLYIANRQTLD